MLRKVIVAPAIAGALALAACGSAGDGGKAAVSPETVKARIERAAHVKLAPEPVPGEAREQGLEASYTNAATAVKDGQVVAVFVMEDAGVADEVSDMVRASAPKSAKLLVNETVMVMYAAAGGGGADRSTAIERAVEELA